MFNGNRQTKIFNSLFALAGVKNNHYACSVDLQHETDHHFADERLGKTHSFLGK